MRNRTALRALIAAAALMGAGLATDASAAQLLGNGSFESPNIGTGNYTYPGHAWGTIPQIDANQGGWTFNNAALVNGSGGNAWYSGAAPAGMDGVQFAALQATSSLSQTFTASAETLHLSWLDAGRSIGGMGAQSYSILLDGIAVGGAFETSSTDPFGLNTLDFSGLTVGSLYNLAFQGLATTDQTAFIDNVRLSDTAPAAQLTGPSIMVIGAEDLLGPNQFMIENFDDPIATGFSFLNGPNTMVRSGALGLADGISAPPPGDTTNYETVMSGGYAVLTSIQALQSISFYMGSPDSYNTVKFSGDNGFEWTLSGSQIWSGASPPNGDQSWGRRINYNFGDYSVNRVEFLSSGNSFEFDSIAGSLTMAVPEPATWALMIFGFGAIGAMLRRRREALKLA